MADKIQLQQVLLNLILNAIEAMQTTKSGRRSLDIEASTQGEFVEISVRDCGSGIPEDKIAHTNELFGPFFSTKEEGMGLGAGDQPFDRRIARRADLGRAKRRTGRHLCLQSAHLGRGVEKMSRNACVYVVEDDDAMAQAVASLIGAIGHENEIYSSAEEFLKAYDPQFTGCLLLDVRLPGMGGLGLQRELWNIGSRLPVIFMTGHADENMADEAMRHGAVGFLEKPFHPQELFEHIEKALRLRPPSPANSSDR